MFSAVLMVAMTTGDVTPARCFGGRGCHGCWGGCHGCWGCYGGCYGCWGCCGGCYGGWGCYGGCYGGYMTPHHKKKQQNQNQDQNSQVKARAKLVVQLPTDATLSINNKQVSTKEGKRVFKTRPLRRGKKYYYTVVASREGDDGQPVTVKKRVRVRAGKTTRVSLTFEPQSLTRK
jgi:uncharacterized protein (TIGR03000 family)